MKKYISILMIVVFIILQPIYAAAGGNLGGQYTINTPWQYPIQPGSEEWRSMDILDAVEMLDVPDYVVDQMTTQALLETVVTYPLLSNVYGFDSTSMGFDLMRTSFYALDALMDRNDALSLMTLYYHQMSETDPLYFVTGALYNYVVSANPLSPDYIIDPITGRIMYELYTPNNSTIYAYKDLTFSDHESITETQANNKTSLYASTYSASIVAWSNPSYNCHSYAWYGASTSNIYWINAPDLYMLDGSYTEVTTPAVGDRVTYKNGTTLCHSGIVTNISGGTVYVTSKWGYLGVMTHTLTSNMYYSTGANNIQYWR